MKQKTYRLIKYTDCDYPEKLRLYSGMPQVLYVKGALPDPSKKTVAIVGARKCSAYGRQTAERFSRVLGENGVQIISGLAVGIDSFAHAGCIKGGGKTFAVMGCGIEHVYPPSNERLYRQIIECKGGIISEFEPSSPPLSYHFPIRNRIISALSDIVIIIEAQKKSGSLITASYALEQGVSIYAVPGKISDTLSFGTNDLIFQGAVPAISPEQILEALGVKTAKEKEGSDPSFDKTNHSDDEIKMLNIIMSNALSLDEICRASGFNTQYVSKLIMHLELKGDIYSPFPGLYSRTNC